MIRFYPCGFRKGEGGAPLLFGRRVPGKNDVTAGPGNAAEAKGKAQNGKIALPEGEAKGRTA